MKNIFFVFMCTISLRGFSQSLDSTKVYDNGQWHWHQVWVFDKDTIEGKTIAVFASDTSVVAYEKNYYLGYHTGVFRSYYPDGKPMEKIIYQKGKRNGEYELRNRAGEVLIKGEYKNDMCHGYWSDNTCRIYGRYKYGLRTGKWKWFYQDRSYHVYIYKKGQMIKKTVDLPECDQLMMCR